MDFLNVNGLTQSADITQPRACVCNTWARFNSGRGSNDTCANCGFNCASGNVANRNANQQAARTTNRRS